MNKIMIVTLVSLITWGANMAKTVAQTSPSSSSSSPETDVRYYIDLNRAKNLARQTAERINGGLGEYRAESSMHGLAQESPYTRNEDGTVTFTFRGYSPGSTMFSVETSITVNQSNGMVTINYNRPIEN